MPFRRDGGIGSTGRASQIADDVIARGWPVGEVLGSTGDFTEQYGVSRAVFREAVRLLEHQQVVRTQRGAAGGLIVTEPSLDAIIDATVLYLSRVDARVEEVRRSHARIAAAVLAGDATLATSRLRRHLEAEAEFLRARDATRPTLPGRAALGAVEDRKRAEIVAGQIYQVVAAGRLEPGTFLGTEPALLERYGVSRAVLREAVRLLEHHDVAATRRGTGGGLYVTAPSPAAVTDVVALYLARQVTGIATVADLRGRVEVALVDLVIDRLDDEGAASLEQAADLDKGDEGAGSTIHTLHAAMANLAGNRELARERMRLHLEAVAATTGDTSDGAPGAAATRRRCSSRTP